MKKKIITLGVTGLLFFGGASVTNAVTVPSGVYMWDYSIGRNGHKSQHIRYGYNASGFRVTRTDSWRAANIRSSASTNSFYSQYNFHANFK